jgi:hypothetical protein
MVLHDAIFNVIAWIYVEAFDSSQENLQVSLC